MSTVENAVHSNFPRRHGVRMAMLVLLAVTISEGYAASVGGGSPPMAGKASMYLPDKSLKQDYSVTAIPLHQCWMPSRRRRRKPRSRHSVRISPKVGFARDAAALSGGFISVALVEIAAGRQAVAAFFDHLAGREALRVAIDLEGLPEETEIRFFGSKNSETRTLHGQIHPCPAGGGKFGGYRIGAGSVLVAGDRGETAKVEIYLPASVEGGFRFGRRKYSIDLGRSNIQRRRIFLQIGNSGSLQHRCQMPGYPA